MHYKEIQGLAAEELKAKVLEMKQELAKEKAMVASGTRSENPGKIRKLRRDIARLLTERNVRKQKEKEEGK